MHLSRVRAVFPIHTASNQHLRELRLTHIITNVKDSWMPIEEWYGSMGRGMSNRTLLVRSVVAYPFVLRDFILNTHIHTYAQTFDKWHNVSFSWQILSRRTHQRELGFHWCLCQISPSMFLSSSLWCFEWAWAISILSVCCDDSKRFRHLYSNGKRYFNCL